MSGVRDDVQGAMRRLGAYFYGESAPHALCVFRISLGIYFLIAWLWKLPWVALLYSNEGMAFPMFEVLDGKIAGPDDLIAIVTQAPPPVIAWTVYLLFGASIVCVTVGWRARIALVALAGFQSYYYFLQLHTVESSYDRMLFIITVLLAMSECGAVYSLDARRRGRHGEEPTEAIPMWPQRLIMLQIVFIYLGTGVYKVMTPDWSTGEIFIDSLRSDWSTSVGYWFADSSLPAAASSLFVLQTVLMEVWSPFLLFHPILRKLFFAWGVGFHISIAILLAIPAFLFMILSYPLFADGAWVREICRTVEARLFGHR